MTVEELIKEFCCHCEHRVVDITVRQGEFEVGVSGEAPARGEGWFEHGLSRNKDLRAAVIAAIREYQRLCSGGI